jgi:hypothetical protein
MDVRPLLLLIVITLLGMGCGQREASQRPNDGCDERLSKMRQQYATVTEEVSLTQVELDEVEQRIASSRSGVTRSPGGTITIYQGPSQDNLRRRDALKDRLVEFKSQQKGLEVELRNLQNAPQ